MKRGVCRGEEVAEVEEEDSEEPSDSEEMVGEIYGESEREEMQRTFEQQ
jgi:hypothetical protein